MTTFKEYIESKCKACRDKQPVTVCTDDMMYFGKVDCPLKEIKDEIEAMFIVTPIISTIGRNAGNK